MKQVKMYVIRRYTEPHKIAQGGLHISVHLYAVWFMISSVCASV